MKHLHHIVPRHMGGTDEPSNLMEVTVEEHAELHFALFLEHGHWEDYIAALSLAGIMKKEEVVSTLLSEAGKKGGSRGKGKTPWNKGKKTGPNPIISEANRKRVWTEEMRQNSSQGLLGKNKGNKRPDLSKYNRERGCVSQRDPETGRFVK